MKKLFFNLILTAIIFTTSPLFAMNDSDNNYTQGRGILCKLNEDTFLNVLKQISDEDVVVTTSRLSRTSKGMWNLINGIWLPLVTRLCDQFTINSALCVKDQFKEHYSLFSNPDQKYKISVAFLQTLKKEPYPDPKYTSSWCFSLGKNRFKMINYSVVLGKHVCGPDGLEFVDHDAIVRFDPRDDYDGHWSQKHFLGLIPLCSGLSGEKEFPHQKFFNRMENHSMFSIVKLN